MISGDLISANWADLENLRAAVARARASLEAGRAQWMSFTNGEMSAAWADSSGDQNQILNANWSNIGQNNEDFLNALDRAIDQAEAALRGAVARACTTMGAIGA